ncbi:MAG: nucleotidyl transferase AbiEii/AbiGii toxin family protein, partial [Acidobacteria bacterium]|nr:nucleotidyl transferase AbiEii/AbiGii toxin family protein [Acidobacteriota bacterium]
KLVARRLEGAGIPYMLTGSMAVSYYAEPRFTRDIDLVVQIGPETAGLTASLFADDFYADVDAIRTAVARRGMVNLIHLDTLTKVDLIVQKPSPYHAEEFDRGRSVIIEETPVWIVSPEDLVISKLSWLRQGGSDVHRRDVVGLLASLEGIDRVYIDAKACELGLADLWRALSG